MNVEQILISFKTKRRARILLHVGLWLFYYLSILYMGSITFNQNPGIGFFLAPLKDTLCTLVVFYFFMYWAWRLLARKRYWMGIMAVVLLIVLYAVLDYWMEQLMLLTCLPCLEKVKSLRNGYYQFLNRGMLNVVFVRLFTLGIVYQLFVYLSFPIVVKVLFEYLAQRINTLRLERENTLLELNFLKAQVNPHFLFNTLNNIYALILQDKKEQSAATVAGLATFMRYTLYETDNRQSGVKKEIELLKAYISLEQIRLNDIVVNFVSTVDNEDHAIPPLLFIPALENAFKYFTRNKAGEAYIFIQLDIQQSQLMFRISNTYDNDHAFSTAHGGIGLTNLRKRLQHYYPGNNYTMEIDDTGGIYRLSIHLNLSQS
jgi:hypothetical protein